MNESALLVKEESRTIQIYIVGNPNSGKTTIFNFLTGLKQKTGNYSGVTIEKKSHDTRFKKVKITLTDLPGTYSLKPRSLDEEIALREIKSTQKDGVLLYVADATSLKLHLYLFMQLRELGYPMVLLINHLDAKTNVTFKKEILQQELEVPVMEFNNIGSSFKEDLYTELIAQQNQHKNARSKTSILEKYEQIDALLKKSQYQQKEEGGRSSFVNALDRLTTHKFWGFVIFAVISLAIFQVIFSWAEYPMKGIEFFFETINDVIKPRLPNHWVSSFLTDGLLSGLAGVLVFVPQIALLFFFINFLEQVGYMPRVSFLLDKIMKKVGLSGKSVIPLLSGYACAIPAIMATRTIKSNKERMIAIMVLPFVTCSARLPVYVLIAAVAIPATKVFGFLDLRGLVLFAMYILGILTSLIAASVISRFAKEQAQSNFFLMEIPSYKLPNFKALLAGVFDKVKIFLVDAGKIILIASLVLWLLGNIGSNTSVFSGDDVSINDSYLGQTGKAIEPVIRPLGYDWKIGIAIVTSFAAREVFVGTLATIYGIENDDEENTGLMAKMKNDYNAQTGDAVFSVATGVSLLLFYAFALQCMSTMAIVKRETQSWKWPIIQFVAMFVLAYGSAFIAFQVFS